MYEIENIPPKIVVISVKTKSIETTGINSKFIATDMVEKYPKAYKQMGVENICADKTNPSEFAIFLGKNLNNLAIGLVSKTIPKTTAKESWNPTESNCTGDNNNIIIAEKEIAVMLSYLWPLLKAKSETSVIIVAIIDDAETEQTPL